jgi:hypothetical protein
MLGNGNHSVCRAEIDADRGPAPHNWSRHGASALNQTDDTGQRLNLAKIASADLVGTKGLCSAR